MLSFKGNIVLLEKKIVSGISSSIQWPVCKWWWRRRPAAVLRVVVVVE